MLTLIFIGQHSNLHFHLLNYLILMMNLFVITIYFNYYLSLFYRLDNQTKLNKILRRIEIKISEMTVLKQRT